ncbi:hypothetical protein MT344_04105 [Clavibacter michiganensis subsp. phaseoli]|uniref:hypothetical protein n=1 Tax=Clavibacter phaseoli TaxID=1734031 RepID=UPI001FB1B5A5|nr:hypothetical protein [Clavibacter phaseoli]MCJ1710366.1 hypothetical protein [Clavibacter phaseoli]
MASEIINNPFDKSDGSDEVEAGKASWSEATDPHGYSIDELLPKDAALQDLIVGTTGTDDDSEDTLGLTLLVSGQTVSGTVISRRVWASEVVGHLSSVRGDDALTESVRTTWAGRRDQADGIMAERVEQDLPLPARRYVHMRQVRIGGSAGVDVSHWRGVLDDVNGWTLGASHS